MKAHFYRKAGKTSPFSRKPITKSHDRGPPRNPKPSARVDRGKMMDSAKDCTIIISLSKFLKKFIPSDLHGFDETFSPDVVKQTFQTFQAIMPEDEEDAYPLEKDISSVWVRSTSSGRCI